MAEENEQENIEEQNQEPEQEEQVVIDGKVRYNPESDNKEWQKMLAITISAFLGGFLAIYFIADRMNHEKAIKAEKAKIAKQNERRHNARINDYGMTYDDDFPEEDFIEKQIKEIENEQDKVLKQIAVNAKLRPVTVSAILEGDVFKVTVRADNYKDEDIKYKFDKKNLTIYGKTKVEENGYIKEIEFSNDLYLPAKPKKELLKTYREGEDWILTVPLDIDD